MATPRKTPARKTAAAKKAPADSVNKATVSAPKAAAPKAVVTASKAAAPKSAVPASKAAAPKAIVAAPHPDKHVDPVVTVAKVKSKRVHGKFAMPKADYALIDELKKLAKKNGQPVRKNELLRAGLRALRAMDALALRGAIAAVRPAPKAAKAKPAKKKGK
jgi:hypothetical protein